MVTRIGIVPLAAGMSLAFMQLPATADVMVDGYAISSDGSVVKSGSGDCVRTAFKDSSEMLKECGYERVSNKAAAVETTDTGTGVAVVETRAVVKEGKLVDITEIKVDELTINNVEFGFDSAELTPEYRAGLDVASEFLRPHRQVLREGLATLDVIGYTDSRGAEAYNQKLSERRAQAVADHLILQDPARAAFIRVIGRGEVDPIASNETEEGRRQNRRVVLRVVPK